VSLTAGYRLGPYQIVAPLGVGGMGEVYRATDTRLDRAVAIKVLPPHLSTNPALRQRFEREARVISSLNHPHICALYDVGETPNPDATGSREPIRFLVMELVEGEPLSDRLIRGPLPLHQALKIAIELADALSTAHRRGIVHRDLKPGNVVVTRTGAKLLDFGLAKSDPIAIAPRSAADNVTALPTTPPDLTVNGAILGTFQYMAPEQLEGIEADSRADIFAFGAVLYEMVCGRRAFAGQSQASLIGAILRDMPPPVSAAVTSAPEALDRVIRKCLAKDPEERWQDARDLRDELLWIAGGSSPSVMTSAPRRVARRLIPWALVGVSSVAAVLFALSYLGSAGTTPPPVLRFTLMPPDGVSFAPTFAPVAPFPALSPDGSRLVFVGSRPGEAPRLWVRSLDSLDARPLNDTTVRTDTLSPALPFWSPDSKSIGFFADGKLKRVDLDGGAARTICDAPQSGGATWSPGGSIVFASKIDEGLRRVDANGGVPAPITTPDRARGEVSHSHPTFLPDGRHFLFWVGSTKPTIRVGSLDSTETKALFDSESRPVYSAGYVLFVRQSTLFAQRFDAARLETIGDPSLVAEDVRTFPLNGRSAFTASNGVLVYRPGGSRSVRSLTWYDRAGAPIVTLPDSGLPMSSSGVTGDERRLIASIDEGSGSDLWLVDLDRKTRSRITADPKNDSSPVVSPDGNWVLFASDRNGLGDLYKKRVDGVGDDQLVVRSPARKIGSDWSAHWMAFTAIDPARKEDIWIVAENGDVRPYLETPFRERDGRLSPDERWMVYTSDEDGEDAIYVRPFPNANGGKWRVSAGGSGLAPRWRADGREIFYIDGGRLVAVPVAPGPQTPTLGAPEPLFASATSIYAVSRDGKRFLMPTRGQADRSDVPLTVVVSWPTLLLHR
jgi:eukaryotic-like serine/threonine-protein kinase